MKIGKPYFTEKGEAVPRGNWAATGRGGERRKRKEGERPNGRGGSRAQGRNDEGRPQGIRGNGGCRDANLMGAGAGADGKGGEGGGGVEEADAAMKTTIIFIPMCHTMNSKPFYLTIE